MVSYCVKLMKLVVLLEIYRLYNSGLKVQVWCEFLNKKKTNISIEKKILFLRIQILTLLS